jgi:hypothetical protein
MADSFLEVRKFGQTRFDYATAKDATTRLLDMMALCVHYGSATSHLAPDYHRYHTPLYLEQFVIIFYHFYGQGSIIDMQLLTQDERCPVTSWI